MYNHKLGFLTVYGIFALEQGKSLINSPFVVEDDIRIVLEHIRQTTWVIEINVYAT